MDDPGPQGREMRNMNPRREEELYKEYNNDLITKPTFFGCSLDQLQELLLIKR